MSDRVASAAPPVRVGSVIRVGDFWVWDLGGEEISGAEAQRWLRLGGRHTVRNGTIDWSGGPFVAGAKTTLPGIIPTYVAPRPVGPLKDEEWCVDPRDNAKWAEEIKRQRPASDCDCGAQHTREPHSGWCSAYECPHS